MKWLIGVLSIAVLVFVSVGRANYDDTVDIRMRIEGYFNPFFMNDPAMEKTQYDSVVQGADSRIERLRADMIRGSIPQVEAEEKIKKLGMMVMDFGYLRQTDPESVEKKIRGWIAAEKLEKTRSYHQLIADLNTRLVVPFAMKVEPEFTYSGLKNEGSAIHTRLRVEICAPIDDKEFRDFCRERIRDSFQVWYEKTQSHPEATPAISSETEPTT